MSALTVTDTLSVPEALAVVRDILAQTDGDAVVLALTERTVFPLNHSHQRFSRAGCAGVVWFGEDRWLWAVATDAYRLGAEAADPGVGRRPRGRSATREAADAALCQALAALGWHCVGAP